MSSKRKLSDKENNSEKIKFRKISNDPRENKLDFIRDAMTKNRKVFKGLVIELERLSQIITRKHNEKHVLNNTVISQKFLIKKLQEQIQSQKNEIELLKQDVAILKNKDTIMPNVFFHGNKKINL